MDSHLLVKSHIFLVLASLLASATILAAPKRRTKNAAPVDPAIKAHDKSSEAMHPFYDDIIFFAANRIKSASSEK